LDLLEYWAEFPPSHLLLRAMARYEGSEKTRMGKSNWESGRAARAREMGDDTYSEKLDPAHKKETPVEAIGGAQGTGAKHIDCAKPHIQQAVERFKKGEHLNVPRS